MAMSTSALALHQLLEEDSPESSAIRKKCHYTALWRYRTGKRKPGVEIAAELERLSGGRVPANGWRDLRAEKAKKTGSSRTSGSAA